MRVFCLWVMVELCEYRCSCHDFDESICCEEYDIDPALGHMKCSEEIRAVSCDDPEEEKYHRNPEIEGLESRESYESMTK